MCTLFNLAQSFSFSLAEFLGIRLELVRFVNVQTLHCCCLQYTVFSNEIQHCYIARSVDEPVEPLIFFP